MAINGTVQVTGPIAPSSTGDTYSTHDAFYGKGGFRNVDDENELHLITDFRRSEGMIVGVSGGTSDPTYYRLLPKNSGNTWTFTMSDWDVAFLSPSGVTSLVNSIVTGITGTNKYTLTTGFTSNIPLTINHNINDSVMVQLIDTNNNEMIMGNIYNYTPNSVDIKLSVTLPNVKIIIMG